MRNGNALIAVLIAGAVISTLLVTLTSRVSSLSQTERSNARQVEEALFFTQIGMLFDDTQTCSKSGLIGLAIDPTTFPSPSYAGTSGPVTLTLPDGTPLAAEGSLSRQLFLINSLRITTLSPQGAGIYSATLTLQSTVNRGGSLPLQPRQFSLNVGVIGNQITSCVGQLKALQATTCPQGTAISSVNSQGVPACGTTLLQAPDYESGWVNMGANGQVTIQHNLGTTNYIVETEWKTDPSQDPQSITFQTLQVVPGSGGMNYKWGADGHLTEWYSATGVWQNKTATTIDLATQGWNIKFNKSKFYPLSATTQGKVRLYIYTTPSG